MKLDIDLNKLSMQELKVVLSLAEKSKTETNLEEEDIIEKEQKEYVPRRKRKNRNGRVMTEINEVYPQIVEWIHKKKKPLMIGEILHKFKLYQNGDRTKYLRDKLISENAIKLISPRFLVSTLSFLDAKPLREKMSTKDKLSSKRASFVMNRANQLMRADKSLSRENAYKRASSEWGTHIDLGEIHPASFNWKTLHREGEWLRNLLSQRFSEGKEVQYSDLVFLNFTDESFYNLFMFKVLKHKNQILQDLGLSGDLIFSNGRLQHRG